MKVLRVLGLAILLTTGCSAFPGLQVLTGAADSPDALAAEVVELSDLVMADKTGSTNPSLLAAADRIETASSNVDIIEIRKATDDDDVFVVNMLFQAPANADPSTQEGQVSLYTAIQRAMELTWQGTLAESEGSSSLRISFISPQVVPTLNNSGESFIGLVQLNAEIDRADALAYLNGPRTLADFLDLIVNGTLDYQTPETSELYEGEPNHPLFMLN